MVGWKISTVLMAIGIVVTVAAERLVEIPETRLYGSVGMAIGLGCIAGSKYVDEQGYGVEYPE